MQAAASVSAAVDQSCNESLASRSIAFGAKWKAEVGPLASCLFFVDAGLAEGLLASVLARP